MSAEVLRRAASLMRERAEAATQGPWGVIAEVQHEDYRDYGGVPGDEPRCGLAHDDAAHIASWHPAVALAVADWLEVTADRCLTVHNSTPQAWYAAVAVATAYLGEHP